MKSPLKSVRLNTLVFTTSILLIAAASGLPAARAEGSAAEPERRERLLMDFGWRFAFGNPSDVRKDFNTGTGYFSYLAKTGYGDGAAGADFDDRGWRVLDLSPRLARQNRLAARRAERCVCHFPGRCRPGRYHLPSCRRE
jgi:hypothetical protein